ncbi:MAG: prolyl oligopeptidase family serine peptidase [Bacteroidales bacterium]
MLLLILPGCGEKKTKTADADDPYIWLEEVDGEKALDWARAQNRISDEALTTLPVFTELRNRFQDAFNDKERIVYPDVTGEMSYNLWQDEKNERGLWRRMPKQDYLAGKDNWETVLDLDLLSAEEGRKWVFGGASWLEPENRYCLLRLSDGGKDESVVREFDALEKKFVDSGFFIAESKSSAAWVNKDQIVVATNYGPGTMTSSGYPAVAKLWKRGDDPAVAQMVYQTDTASMGIFVGGENIKGKQYVFLDAKKGFYETTTYILTAEGLKVIDIPRDVETRGMFSEMMLLYLQSDWNINGGIFKRGTLVSFDLPSYLSGETQVKTIYEPSERASLAGVMATRDFIVAATMDNVQGRLTIFRPVEGKWAGEAIPVPEFGTVGLAGSDDQSNDWFFTFSNPVTPITLYYGDGKVIRPLRKQQDYFDASGAKVDQYEAISKDGTKVPYFIVHRNDMAFDGTNATLIDGYGGFNVPSLPYYSSVTGIGWIEKGGVYVIANIRGGGEFGPAWHQSALREKRQNAYDDFFAVAEDLIRRNITSQAHLGAYGWSNGGLLAGVALTQRPDLWNAVVIGAPLLDMKRYSKLLAGASWMDEYGNPDVPADWEFISKYSPYQNVKKDARYPTPLFITSTRDDRVHPGHARKMAAKMTEMGHPVYYHETIEGGHGAASTNAQEAEIWALMYTYLRMKLFE